MKTPLIPARTNTLLASVAFVVVVIAGSSECGDKELLPLNCVSADPRRLRRPRSRLTAGIRHSATERTTRAGPPSNTVRQAALQAGGFRAGKVFPALC